MRISDLINYLKTLTPYVLSRNSLNITNFKLLLNALKRTITAYLKQERSLASEIYWTERFFLLDQKDPIKFIERRRKVKDAFPEEVIKELVRLKEQINNNKPLKLLEIGSGPVSNIAYYVDQNIFTVTGIDPLAEAYKTILKKLNYDYPIVPIKMTGEELLSHFKEDSFHVVFSLNAMDHTEDPVRCLKNAYHLLKKEGLFFLYSNYKEGSRLNWSGLHKHDLYFENNILNISNQHGNITTLFNDNKMPLNLFFYDEKLIKNNVKIFRLCLKKQ